MVAMECGELVPVARQGQLEEKLQGVTNKLNGAWNRKRRGGTTAADVEVDIRHLRGVLGDRSGRV